MRNSVRAKKRERDCRNAKKKDIWRREEREGGKGISLRYRITKSQETPSSETDDGREEAKIEGQKDNVDRKD